jgi:serine/threonine protein kinase/tetratricopeptide (TPR) repeat protein
VEPRTVAHFDVTGRLGAGGMGVVYRARDRVLGREVALKLVRPEQVADFGARQRFLREARAAAVLSHPGIATVYEAGEAAAEEPGGPPQLYIAEELVDGETLAERLRRGPLAIEDVVGFGAQIADALGEAHARGIVHRDVKPSNVMVGPEGRLKILDFGLARRHVLEASGEAADTETWSRSAPGTIAGTPAYMAPEQIAGEAVDARADVYSAGCVLYEMLSGQPPFTGATTAEVLRRSLTETPRPIAELRRDVPAPLAEVVTRALSRDPRDRPHDGGALASALREAGSPPTLRAGRPIRSRWRRPARAAMTVLAVLGLGGLSWLLLERFTRPALAFKERDFVLVADVVNVSGEPVFDLALKSAIETDLRQSRYVNVVDSAQVQNTLRLMRRKGDARLDSDLGRQVCRRAGARALVVPTVLKAGEAYQIGASLVEPASGRVVSEVRVNARSREQVLLSSIDQLTRELRERLGESLTSIARTDPPFAHYTTSSLEALDLLAMGTRAWARGDFTKAERSFREALQHDPRFAAARGSLGLVLIQFLGRPEEGKAELKQALADAGDVSPRESLPLRALYKQFVAGDLPGALEDYRFISDLYPDMMQPYNNSGRIYAALGRYSEAEAMYERAHLADPRSAVALWNSYFLCMGPHLPDPACAERAARALASIDPGEANAAAAVAWSLVMQRRFAEAEEATQATLELDPEQPYALPNLAHLQLRRGAAEEAVATYRRLDAMKPEARKQTDPDHNALCLGLALRQAGRAKEGAALMQRTANAVRDRLAGHPRSAGEEALLASLLAGAGQTSEARALLKRVERRGDVQGDDATWLARAYAFLGETDRATALYVHAVETGYTDPYFVLIDPTLASIRDRPEIDRLLPAGAPAASPSRMAVARP